jgi:hypothetical protein
MPFKSKAQQRWAFAGGLSRRKAKEWADKTDFKAIPERTKKAGVPLGRRVGGALSQGLGMQRSPLAAKSYYGGFSNEWYSQQRREELVDELAPSFAKMALLQPGLFKGMAPVSKLTRTQTANVIKPRRTVMQAMNVHRPRG